MQFLFVWCILSVLRSADGSTPHFGMNCASVCFLASDGERIHFIADSHPNILFLTTMEFKSTVKQTKSQRYLLETNLHTVVVFLHTRYNCHISVIWMPEPFVKTDQSKRCVAELRHDLLHGALVSLSPTCIKEFIFIQSFNR
jgi:hypothetical protein